MRRTPVLILCTALLFLTAPAARLSAADLTVPEMELITRASVEDGSVVLDTVGDIDIAVEGGYKLGGSLTLGIESDRLGSPASRPEPGATDAEIVDYLDQAPYLFLKSAKISVSEAFGLPLRVSYFTGETDTFANGDLFPRYFASAPVASLFRGYMYFPGQVVYDGLYTVNGTGLQLESDFGRPWNLLSFYTYQDNYLGRGQYSTDLRWAVNSDFFKLETFAGGSYPYGEYGMYHAGVLVGLMAKERGEFFAQVGIPRLAPGEDELEIGLFYFLFEPRIHFGIGSLIFTFFSHPTYYKEYLTLPTGETGDMHTNVNLLFGKPEVTPLAGGLEGTIVYSDDSDITGIVSPYLSFITQGAVWRIKFNWVATEWSDTSQMFNAYIGVRAEL